MLRLLLSHCVSLYPFRCFILCTTHSPLDCTVGYRYECAYVVKDQGAYCVTVGKQNCWLFSHLNRRGSVFKTKSQWEGETIDAVWM